MSIKNTYKTVLCTYFSEEQRGKLARQVKQQFLQRAPLSESGGQAQGQVSITKGVERQLHMKHPQHVIQETDE